MGGGDWTLTAMKFVKDKETFQITVLYYWACVPHITVGLLQREQITEI